MSNRPPDEELAAHIKRHIDEDGVYCPACGSDDYHMGRLHFECDASGVWARCVCSCGTVWFDCFTLARTEIVRWRGEL